MNDWFFLNTYSISHLILAILAGTLTLYLLSVRDKSRATWHLTIALALIAVAAAGQAAWISLDPMHFRGWRGWIAFSSGAGGMTFSSIFLIQFAYAFVHNPYPKEARWVLVGSVILAALVAGLDIHLYARRFGGSEGQGGLPPSVAHLVVQTTPMFPLFADAWATVVLARKLLRARRSARVRPFLEADPHPEASPARAARAYRALLLTFLIFAAAAVGYGGILPGTGLNLLSYLLSFAGFLGLVIVHVNYASEPTTFQVKLVGLSLVTMLSILAVAAVALFGSPYEVKQGVADEIGATIAPRSALRFEREPGGGYWATASPFQFDTDRGTRLDLGDDTNEAIPLGFAFPFYDAAWDSLFVSANGLVSFDRPINEPEHGLYSAGDRYNTRPKIALLHTDLNPTQGGGVYLRRDAAQVVVTWHEVPRHDKPEIQSAQLVLSRDGAIEFRYDHAPSRVTTFTLANGIFRGLHPGGPDPAVERVRFDASVPLRAAAGTGLVEDAELLYRQAIHARMVPLFWLVFGASAFILLIFPLFFRTGLVKPLNRLLDGVRQVNEGARDVAVPVVVNDEIGRLTRNFNRMTASLREAEEDLRAYAEKLEDRVAERTAEVEHKNAELQASQAQLEAQAAQLLELDALKSRFFANISHEFRTPLTLILGPLRDALTGRYGALDDRLQRQLGLMQRNGQRLLRLINQLLDLAKLEAGGLTMRARQADLVPFLRSLVLAFSSRAEREGLTLLFHSPEASILVYYDRDKLEKVVYNLLSNAFKFTPRGGKIRVSAEVVREAESEHVEIAVKDTGRGIPAEALPYVFDRFRQVDDSLTRAHEGTGIGLALAKELVALHGGEIRVESEVAFGTTFTVALPLGAEHLAPGDLAEEECVAEDGASEEARSPINEAPINEKPFADAEDAEQQAPHSMLGAPTILIVEDNPDMRAYLRDHLAATYQIFEACDGEEGREQARALTPDLIISDVMMPRMDGYALCRALKGDKRLNHIPLVLLTAKADEESKLEGLDTGADDYLSKPFSAEELLARCENLIAVRRLLRERFSREVAVGPRRVIVPSAETAWLERVEEVVEAHLSDPDFGVDWLADEVALSPRQLQRRLKQAVDLSPSGFIRTMRLQRAAQLLEQRAGGVAEVAYAVGFRNVDHFSKLFCSVFGLPPSAYPPDATS